MKLNDCHQAKDVTLEKIRVNDYKTKGDSKINFDDYHDNDDYDYEYDYQDYYKYDYPYYEYQYQYHYQYPEPVNCRWGMWNHFSTCSRNCGGGTQTRRRSKLVIEKYGGTCTGLSTETRACNTQVCFVPQPIPGNIVY